MASLLAILRQVVKLRALRQNFKSFMSLLFVVLVPCCILNLCVYLNTSLINQQWDLNFIDPLCDSCSYIIIIYYLVHSYRRICQPIGFEPFQEQSKQKSRHEL